MDTGKKDSLAAKTSMDIISSWHFTCLNKPYSGYQYFFDGVDLPLINRTFNTQFFIFGTLGKRSITSETICTPLTAQPMQYEIERKFLLQNDEWRHNARGLRYRQGYILSDPKRTIRIRTIQDSGFITIKGKGNGLSRPEFEYSIPFDDAKFLLENFCDQPIIEKIRYKVEFKGMIWEIDEFLGDNEGLQIAEIELTSEDQLFAKPKWIGSEVTGDRRYYNSYLARNSYKNWGK
jgi:adenylate cyclase